MAAERRVDWDHVDPSPPMGKTNADYPFFKIIVFFSLNVIVTHTVRQGAEYGVERCAEKSVQQSLVVL